MSNISNSLIEQTSKGVQASLISDIVSFHTTLTSLLPEYETFLQGSYKNDTAISEINDVDIVVLEKPSRGRLGVLNATSLFPVIQRIIEQDRRYRGKVTAGNKCLKVQLATKKADIVPATHGIFALQRNNYGEPILIANNVHNYPKTHWYIGSQKNIRTGGNYKPVVRMLKNYVNNWELTNFAPSYYLECLVHSYSDYMFTSNLPLSLYNILNHMCGTQFDRGFKSVARDKVIISQVEWNPLYFFFFKESISSHLINLYNALVSTSEVTANDYYRRFFNL